MRQRPLLWRPAQAPARRRPQRLLLLARRVRQLLSWRAGIRRRRPRLRLLKQQLLRDLLLDSAELCRGCMGLAMHAKFPGLSHTFPEHLGLSELLVVDTPVVDFRH